jgi:hypothetical protein
MKKNILKALLYTIISVAVYCLLFFLKNPSGFIDSMKLSYNQWYLKTWLTIGGLATWLFFMLLFTLSTWIKQQKAK